MPSETAITFLNELDGTSEAHSVSKYTARFGSQEVIVEVYDYGANAGQHRYMVASYLESEGMYLPDGSNYSTSFQQGNTAPDLTTALQVAHFYRFRQ